MIVSSEAYSYTGGNPVNEIDPLGQLSFWGIVSVGSGFLAAATSFIPGAEVVSEGFAVAAVIADVGQCLTEGCNWPVLVLDIVALVPGAAAVHFASAAEKSQEVLEGLEIVGKIDKSIERDHDFQKAVADFMGNQGAAVTGVSEVVGGIEEYGSSFTVNCSY